MKGFAKGIVKGIVVGAGAVAAAVGGIAAFTKLKLKEVRAAADAKEPMKFDPEQENAFLEDDEPTVEVEETK